MGRAPCPGHRHGGGALLGLAALTGGLATGRALAASSGWPLWVVKSGTGVVYLTGETPGGHTDWNDARIEGLVPSCDALWTEAGTISRDPVGPLIVRYGYDPKTPLATLLGEDDKARLKAAAALAVLPVEQLGSARPWLAAYELEHSYARATGHTGLSANQVLAADANKAGVPVHSEFPAQDDTIAAYGALSPLADLQFLRFTLDDILAAPGEIDREIRVGEGRTGAGDNDGESHKPAISRASIASFSPSGTGDGCRG